MTTDAIIAAIAEWLVEKVPEVDGNVYEHMPSEKTGGLPDAVVEIVTDEVVREHPEFPKLQQVVWNVRAVVVNFMVDTGSTEADALAGTRELRSFIDRLKAALLADHTLGGRVPFASPYLLVEAEPRYVEWGSGTRGRESVAMFHVGEPLVDED